jgi:hypothetical protein
MNKKNIITGLWVVIFFLPTIVLQAQNKPSPKPVAKPMVPVVLPDTIKLPKFTVRFGPFNGASPALAGDLKRVLPNGISITDQQGQKWTPLSWMFIWNRQEQSNDIRTGKIKTITTYNAVVVDSSAVLPASWQREIQDYLRSGEEFIIEKLIIEQPGSKRKMMAPDWRIKLL